MFPLSSFFVKITTTSPLTLANEHFSSRKKANISTRTWNASTFSITIYRELTLRAVISHYSWNTSVLQAVYQEIVTGGKKRTTLLLDLVPKSELPEYGGHTGGPF